MKKRVLFTRPVIKVLTAFAVVVGIAAVIYSMSGFPAPSEANRVWAPDGSFSIIKPHGWDAAVMQSPSGDAYSSQINITSPNSIGLGEQLFIGRLLNLPDLQKLKSNGFIEQEFQGRQAWVLGYRTKIDYRIEMLFRGEDQTWYKLVLNLGHSEERLEDSKWWPFVMSFKSRPKAGASPNSQIPASSQ